MVVVAIIILVYALMMFAFALAWCSIPVRKSTMTAFPKVSVLVVARNEESNIATLLYSLAKQTYPNWELIIVDDHSTDSTYTIVSEFDLPVPKKLLNMPDTVLGKKSGLAFGIAQAEGDYILCTDADCTFNPDWITSMITCQQVHKARFVFGPVDILLKEGFFSRLQRMEFFGLIGSGASSLVFGVPSMCNGANLLFEKEAFNSVGGYTDLQTTATGDDVLLMMKLRERFPDSVIFSKHYESIVNTKPQLTLIDFVNQRSRWASKFGVYKGIGVKVIALIVFAAYMAILVAIPLMIYTKANVLLFLSAMLVKLTVDYLFLHELQKFYKTKFDLLAFIALQLTMPLYVTFFGILGRRKTFLWKGRTCT